MIFVCANCTSFSPQPVVFNSARITHFLYAWNVSTPQLKLYSEILTAYLCMIFVCTNCDSFSPQPTIFNSACITYFL